MRKKTTKKGIMAAPASRRPLPAAPEFEVPDLADPVFEAGRLVSKVWDGTGLTAQDRSRLGALDYAWCPTCHGYQRGGHSCWTPAVAERLAVVTWQTTCGHALADLERMSEARQIAESIEALGRALYLEDAVEPPIVTATDNITNDND